MKYKNRPKSRNITDIRTNNQDGRRNQFINESLRLGVENHKPSQRFTKNIRKK